MNKIQNIIDELWHGQPLKFVWQQNNCMQNESYHAKYAGKILHVQARDSKSALYAAFQLHIASQTSELSSCLNRVCAPLFPLRPLWVGCDLPLGIASSISCAIPCSWTDQKQVEQDCLDLLRWGYNAFILGASTTFALDTARSCEKELLTKIVSICSHYGIYVVIALHEEAQHAIDISQKKQEKKIHDAFVQLRELSLSKVYILWQGIGRSFVRLQKEGDSITESEWTIAQVKMLLKIMSPSFRLIYCLPYDDLKAIEQQAAFLPQILFELPPEVIFAFSVRAGVPTRDHLPLHPLLEKSRKSLHSFSLRLMPIFNAGLIEQGEGLWPVVPYDSFQNLFPYFCSCCFYGAIGLTHYLPQPPGLLDLSLWMYGLSQWNNFSVHFMPEAWFSMYHGVFDFRSYKKNIVQFQQIVLAFNLFMEKRNIADRKQLQILVDSISYHMRNSLQFQEQQSEFWQKYIYLFLMDIDQAISAIAVQQQLRYTAAINSGHEAIGFWSAAQTEYSNNLKTYPKRPQEQTEKMQANQTTKQANWPQKIWDDNRKNDTLI